MRLTAVDALRGAVMVIMALDHVRDFVHAGAMTFSPEDLSQTTPLLFFTRGVTHICAPTFVFLAGIGAYPRLQRDGSPSGISRFLWTRGLWLVLVEVTVMRLAINFTFSSSYPVLLLVLWALSISMVVMAVLVYLPVRIVAALALASSCCTTHSMVSRPRSSVHSQGCGTPFTRSGCSSLGAWRLWWGIRSCPG